MSAWHAGSRLAVLGANRGSLGEAVAFLADVELGKESVDTFGPNPDHHDYYFDVRSTNWDKSRMLEPYDNVVCTVGVNLPDEEDPDGLKQMAVNFHGVMRLAEQWARLGKPGHFVVISSNSAHVARSASIGYCASKAALSMGIRCLARREASVANPSQSGIFYAWEFGLLQGTPMTKATAARLPGVPLTRMPGLPNGIPVDLAAGHVYSTLKHGWRELNGTTLRLDAGEQ